MKRFPLILCLSAFLLASCGKSVSLPRPTEPKGKETIAQKDLTKKKNSYILQVTELEKELDNLNSLALDKRSKGYNTSEAESVLVSAEKAIGEVKNLIFWEKFEDLRLKVEEIKILSKKIRRLISRAPLFGESEKKEVKSIKEYADARDYVRELRGEPERKSFGGMKTLGLNISNPSERIVGSQCWENMTHRFVLTFPPQVEIWEYDFRQTIYVFMQTNSVVKDFMVRDELSESNRDLLLARLCESQIYGGYELIYVGDPITDTNQIYEQVLSGTGRHAGMFGVGSLGDLAKATAALSDLDVVAVALSAELETLNNFQDQKYKEFEKILESVAPEILGIILDLKASEQFEKIYKKTESAELPLSPQTRTILDKLKEIRDSKEEDSEKRKRIQKLVGSQSKVFKQRLAVATKPFDWQRSLRLSEGDIKDFKKAFPEVADHAEKALMAFKDSLENLIKEFQNIRNNLIKFRNKGTFELVFREGKPPAVFFLLQGVRFDSKTLSDGSKVEKPDISVKIKVELRVSSEDQPSLLYEFPEIKIENANRFIDEVKEFQRLTSFGIRFPTTLVTGNYIITFTITDNLRVQTVEQIVTWLIVPEPEP